MCSSTGVVWSCRGDPSECPQSRFSSLGFFALEKPSHLLLWCLQCAQRGSSSPPPSFSTFINHYFSKQCGKPQGKGGETLKFVPR